MLVSFVQKLDVMPNDARLQGFGLGLFGAVAKLNIEPKGHDMCGEKLISKVEDWDEMRRAFNWPNPARYNIAEQICERWARSKPNRLALTYLDADGEMFEYTYRQLSRASSGLANAMRARGLQRGDRCAVLLPQTPETALTHIACYKLGVIVVPLFTLFGEDGLQYRMENSGAKAVIADAANIGKVLNIRDTLPDLQLVYSIDGGGAAYDFWRDIDAASDTIEMANTLPDDPAFISYTSGTTGAPKGALHGHRVLLGHLPGIETHHNFFPQKNDCLWTPADWAWVGGLVNVMMPALNYGVPLVAHRMSKFDPDHAFWLIDKFKVRNSFLPPTALKLMRQASEPAKPLNLRSVGSGGEALGGELLDWGRRVLGVTINEFYGQTECNLVLGNCVDLMQPRAGSTGKPVPGHEVAIIDSDGQVLPVGEVGEIAVKRPDPVMFLEYWKNPEKTAEKFIGDWMLTSDEGYMDDEGYFFFSSRTDDVITSSGYRIGPTEIEDCLTGHPKVSMAAVIGVPDEIRTEIIKAYVVASDTSDELKVELILRVRERISPHVAPRELEFIDALPMTATGKIMRRELKKLN